MVDDGSGVARPAGWRDRLPGFVSAAVAFDRAQARPAEAARASVGVAVPLIIGVASGQIPGGLAASLGALCAGFASLQGVYRSRAATVVAASVGMALATFSGELAAHSNLASVLLAAGWGFAAGLLVVLGQAASVVGLQWVVAFLVVSQLAADPAQAATRAALVLAGGLGQTVLVTVLWPLGRHHAERRALAAVFAGLARYAEAIGRGQVAPPDPLTPGAAARALADPQPFASSQDLKWLHLLFERAESLRSSLANLAVYRGERAAVARLAAAYLDQIAAVLVRARASDPPLAGGGAAVSSWPLEPVLRRNLRSVLELAAAPGSATGTAPPATVRAYRRLAGGLRGGADALRANLTLRSAGARHAIRLSAVLAVTTAVSRLGFVPHGYWLPLTALVVLKPDFSTTMSRGLARVTGTLFGAGVATLLAAALRPGPAILVLLVLAAAFFGFWVVRANYALFAVAVTSFVVFLLALAGLPELTLVADRAIDTVVGGILALVAYLVWPTWEAATAASVLADLVEAMAGYAAALLRGGDPARVGAARAKARLARSNAEASVQRMRAEPLRRGGLSPAAAEGLLSGMRQFALAALALEEFAGSGSLSWLADWVDPRLRACAGGLRGLDRAAPPLAGLLRDIGASDFMRGAAPALAGLDRSPERGVGELAPAVEGGVDLMIDAVEAVLAAVALAGRTRARPEGAVGRSRVRSR